MTTSTRIVSRPRAAYSDLGKAHASDRVVTILTACVFVLSVGFFSVVTTISYFDPDFFERLLIADIERIDIDPMAVGSTAKAAPGPIAIEPMPVPTLSRARELRPNDFSIVMVFGDEAHLASPGEIWRVKVGMILPGLGEIFAIDESENGGMIRAENAILTGVPN